MPRRPKLVALVVAGALCVPTASANAASSTPPTLEVDGNAQAGHATLRWKSSTQPARATTQFQVQQSESSNFEQGAELLYQGPHHSSVLSGLPNGTSYYRARSRVSEDAEWGSWSSPAAFEVQHYSPQFAGTLFGLGALVFLCIVGFLVTMSRRSDNV